MRAGFGGAFLVHVGMTVVRALSLLRDGNEGKEEGESKEPHRGVLVVLKKCGFVCRVRYELDCNANSTPVTTDTEFAPPVPDGVDWA